jgi:hypothetical protein
MKTRVWLILSLGLNLFLAAGLYVATRPLEEPNMTIPPVVSSGLFSHTNVVVRHENFTWQQVESTNYLEFIKNLRSIECPDQTIRDIIVSEVNRLYSGRRLNEVIYPNFQWWRSDPDPDILQSANAKIQSLEAERRDLLTSLLGPGWDAENNALIAARAGITLTGPILGDMSPAAKFAAFAIIASGQQKIQDYEDNQHLLNKPVDPMEMVRLREEPFLRLVSILTPQQYDEFVLRFSPAAQELREQMRGLDLTLEQFRDLFNAVGTTLGEPLFYYAGNDPQLAKQQQQLQAQSQAIIKTVLGADLYSAYQLDHDALYRTSQATAQQLAIPAASVMPMYEINRATQAELARISKDDTLSSDEKVQALAQARVEQQQALEQLLGADAFDQYLQSTATSVK